LLAAAVVQDRMLCEASMGNNSAEAQGAVSPVQMHEVTLALRALREGDPRATDELLELVYDELRKLARIRAAREPGGGAGMTLDATALVHEAYLRVIGDDRHSKEWEGRGHFFAAAALAMRRILVERARHRKRIKHGGDLARVDLSDAENRAAAEPDHTDLIDLDEVLTRLERLDPRKAKVVSLRYFAGLSIEETAHAMDLSPATVKNEWAFARAWLHRELSGGESTAPTPEAPRG
jgi:RNA polymerase sigma factor (TIGR02999 family)